MYSRTNPSPFYRALIQQYIDMHGGGYKTSSDKVDFTNQPEKVYPGSNIKPFTKHIKALIEKHGAKTILDYGCGKGEQYSWKLEENPADPKNRDADLDLPTFWNIPRENIHLYEPALTDKADVLPQVDGVITTDVLEHCHMADMPWIVEELFQKANKFVFANIASYNARALLPCGENAHISIRPGVWWGGFFQAIAARYPHIDYVLSVDEWYPNGEKYRFFIDRPTYPDTPNTFATKLDDTTRVEILPTLFGTQTLSFK